MLWNWDVIDACTFFLFLCEQKKKKNKSTDKTGFISTSWQIKSHGMFAGSCIGVILLVMSLEALRRLSKEYDRYILRRFKRQVALDASYARTPIITTNTENDSTAKTVAQPQTKTVYTPPLRFRPSLVQQSIRALLHMVTFAVAYFVMLLAMYYNGYFIICIFIGAYLGGFVFSWESIAISAEWVFLPLKLGYVSFRMRLMIVDRIRWRRRRRRRLRCVVGD